MEILTLRVLGTPAPQGSKAGYVRGGRAVLVESSAKVKPWRQDVAAAAEQRVSETGWQPPMFAGVALIFYLARPRSVRRLLPGVKPDLDKLVRSTLDALTTAGALLDDATVVRLTASKEYALDGQAHGAQISVFSVSA